jgi:hypothetical protein
MASMMASMASPVLALVRPCRLRQHR